VYTYRPQGEPLGAGPWAVYLLSNTYHTNYFLDVALPSQVALTMANGRMERTVLALDPLVRSSLSFLVSFPDLIHTLLIKKNFHPPHDNLKLKPYWSHHRPMWHRGVHRQRDGAVVMLGRTLP
jgi:hypothetical protein